MGTAERLEKPGIRGWLHQPAKVKAAMLLSHGAGGDCKAPLMVAVAKAFCEAGYLCFALGSAVSPSGPARRTRGFGQARPRRHPGGCAGTAQARYGCPAVSRRAILRWPAVEHGGGRRPQRGRRTPAALLSAASARKACPASNRSLWFTADSRAFCSWHARSLRLGGGTSGSDQADPGPRACRWSKAPATECRPPPPRLCLDGFGMSETLSWKKGTDYLS